MSELSFRYTVRQLLYTKRWFDDNPDGILKIPIWPNSTYTREQWHTWFLSRLNAKINRNEPKRGRKDCSEWFSLMQRVAREVNTPKLIVRWIPCELRGKLNHRLTTEKNIC